MIKREILLPLIVALLLIVFWGLGILIILRPGRKLVRSRLRLGGLILTLSLLASCSQPPPPTCYSVPIDPEDTATGAIENADHQYTDTLADSGDNDQKNPGLTQDTVTTQDIPSHEIRCYVPPHDIDEYIE